MIKEGDKVLVKLSAPKCKVHRGKIGTVERIRYARGAGVKTIDIVRFPDRRAELLKEKDLEKII